MSRLLFVLAGTLLLTACLGGIDPAPGRNYGFIVMDTRSDGENYSTVPIGIFYRSVPLAPPSPTPRDLCFAGTFDSTRTGINPSLDHLDPGSFIAVTVGGSVAEMVPKDSVGAILFRPDAPVQFVPGDSAVFESEGGADLPPFVIRARTAEPFTMNPVGLPAVGASLPLTWTGATTPNSKMIVSLRWENEGDPDITHQLYCELDDDGSFSIPTSQVIGWRSAFTRQVVATRERVVAPAMVGVTLAVISTFEIAVPVNQ